MSSSPDPKGERGRPRLGALAFPLADVPHHHGLSFADAMSALEVFIARRKFAGLVITEFNADRDTDGTLARRFVDAVAKVLGKKVIKSGK